MLIETEGESLQIVSLSADVRRMCRHIHAVIWRPLSCLTSRYGILHLRRVTAGAHPPPLRTPLSTRTATSTHMRHGFAFVFFLLLLEYVS